MLTRGQDGLTAWLPKSTGSFGKQDVGNVLQLDYCSGCTGICICQNLKWVHFIMCKLHLQKVDVEGWKRKKILWLRKLMQREKSSRSWVETGGYLVPEGMNSIKTDLMAGINVEPFASDWTNGVIWDRNKRSLLYLVWNLKLQLNLLFSLSTISKRNPAKIVWDKASTAGV